MELSKKYLDLVNEAKRNIKEISILFSGILTAYGVLLVHQQPPRALRLLPLAIPINEITNQQPHS